MFIGIGIAGAAYGTRLAIRGWELHGAKIMAAIPRPGTIGAGSFYKGGFEAKMDKREAALILGVKYVLPFSSSPLSYILSIPVLWLHRYALDFPNIIY